MANSRKILSFGLLVAGAYVLSKNTGAEIFDASGLWNPDAADYDPSSGALPDVSAPDFDPWADGWGDSMTNGGADGGIVPAGGVPRSVGNGADNLRAFLKMTRVVESGDNYRAIVGGSELTDFSEHPWVLNPALPLVTNSNASGAYQILAATPRYPNAGTWQIARDAAGVRDFSPASQDAAAIAILKFPYRNGAYQDVIAGRFATAMRKLVLEWEAFKKILAGAYPYTLDDAERIYTAAGGAIAPADTVIV